MKPPILLLAFLTLFSIRSNAENINIRGDEFVLGNGLKVIVVEDHKAPLTACRLYYKVGSIYEQIGSTGLSHMLEHMMFKGTETIGVKDPEKDRACQNQIDSLYHRVFAAMASGDSLRVDSLKAQARKLMDEQRKNLIDNELWETYLQAGGTQLNAYTADFLTAFIVTLPSNKVELFFWLEADRMKNPVFREFYTERDVVKEERRMRYEDSPYGRYLEELAGMFYEAHPYRLPTIGYMSDLDYLKREDAMNHFKRFYVPNNAILVLVGDIRLPEARRLSEKYFGPVPAGKEPIPDIHTMEPGSVGEKRLTMEKAVAPRVDLWFATPGIGDDRLYALDVLEGILNGKSGRLYKRLVEAERLCVSISAGNDMNKYISQFSISAVPKTSIAPDTVEKIIWQEIEKIKREPVTPRELEKVKNAASKNQVDGLRSPEHLADELAFLEVCGGWRRINEYLDKVEAVTPEMIRRAAGSFLIRRGLTAGNVIQVPDSASGKEGRP